MMIEIIGSIVGVFAILPPARSPTGSAVARCWAFGGHRGLCRLRAAAARQWRHG
jgi:hypothetical protein